MEKKNRLLLSETDGLNTQGHSTAPIVSGQCAEVLALIREHQPLLALALPFEYGIPQYAARIHDLRELGFNIQTRILSSVSFRDRERRNVAEYHIGTPEWPRPDWQSSAAGMQPDLFAEMEGGAND